MDQDQDLVVFADEAGNKKTMEVLDYFFYEGQEYAVLTEVVEDSEESDESEDACDCEEEDCDCDDDCDCCGHDHEEEMELFIMRVVPVGDDQEEFLPVEDELMDELIEFVQNELYADDEEYMDDSEDTEEE